MLRILHYTSNKNSTITMLKGESILEALRRNEFLIASECGGMGICGKCIIRLIEGKLDITSQDKIVFSDSELRDGYRLACMAYPNMDCTIMLSSGINVEFDVVTETITRLQTLVENKKDYAIAIDLGTTTLALALISYPEGNIVKKYSTVNPQRVYGADVVSRIKMSNEGNSGALSNMIRQELIKGIHILVKEQQITPDRLKQIVIGANTTMIHLLMEYSCDGLGSFPFIPVNLGLINTYTDDIFDMDEKIPVIILPGISVYVGGDITAGLLATGLHQKEKPCLFIDLGTNGEIVIGNKERILATSTAAGPAFEGGNISCGVASIPGAICHVSFDDMKLSYETINNEPPIGLCGTGVIELVSELCKEGIIDSSGLLADPYFDVGYPIAGLKLKQQDVRELQLAKAAIRAGVDTLLEKYGIGYEDLEEVYIAGGFGYRLDIDKTIYIGLLPETVRDKVKAVGNTSLSGAICSIIDSEALKQIDKIISSSREIHLSNTDEFKDLYIKHLSF